MSDSTSNRDPRQPHRTPAGGREQPRTWGGAALEFVKRLVVALVTGGRP